ncbi:RNA polymerase subunit sigma [Viridibacillus sp. YIM B01967]|uniref:RNA polymerase subunit sigma n=1 Tax=Viridibacillus soli TaxID=2798301 RepID=A0ABS1H4L7_9BACL|nr:RNA polymerase subunit sigma [Viridibacillus soli]MBK3494363.1 RNA polymerase subunit sigma [Viridibacillus soli]
MSLKGVELQIAIPKTFEAGKMADQAQQQVNVNQDSANAALQRQIERNRTAVLQSESTDEINDEEPSTNDQSGSGKHGKQKQESEEANERAKHPYKGQFVDFSG